MKALKLMPFTVLILPGIGTAQVDIPIDDLVTPTIPAQTLFDSTPTVIAEPTSPQALQTALQTALGGPQSGADAQSICFQFSPYLIFGDPKSLTLNDYYTAQKVTETAKQTFSLSVAAQDFEAEAGDEKVNARGLAFGFRVQLWRKVPANLERIMAFQSAIVKNKDAYDAAFGAAFDALGAAPNTAPGSATEAITLKSSFKPSAEDLAEIRELLREQVGWSVELAGALRRDDYEGELLSDGVSRKAVWITVGYTPPVASIRDFTFLAVVRRTSFESDANRNASDLGARLLWRLSQKMDASAEYLSRSQGDNDSDRYSVLIRYAFADRYSINVAYGRNFAATGSDEDDFFTVSLSGGFGSVPLLK